jgi:hypothetical protein
VNSDGYPALKNPDFCYKTSFWLGTFNKAKVALETALKKLFNGVQIYVVFIVSKQAGNYLWRCRSGMWHSVIG